MAKDKISYHCRQCQYTAPSYLGKCPECEGWGTFVEQRVAKAPAAKEIKRESVARSSGLLIEAIPLSDVKSERAERTSSGYHELDRVLGGGIIPGSYVLIGGDPGIGKSTLMLQMAAKVSTHQMRVLYVAGEESPYQIKMRADRLGIASGDILIYPETEIHKIVEEIRSLQPDVVIIDSIQAMYSPELSGGPGSVGQMKECASILMGVAKSLGVTIFLVGHVTKEGAVSGPKLLEHTVDAVLYFEGEKYKNLRLLRSVKNRFGNTSEVGVFEMEEEGLSEVENPSELFLSESSYQNNPGSVILSTMEGTRPLLVELQALVGQSAYATPRRIANGVEYNRLHQIIAVLERRLGLDFSHHDVYVNVVGGMRIEEPAADLGIALAILTSQRNLSIRFGTVVAGEIGLTGEIRPVRQWETRMREAEKLGFHRIILPQTSLGKNHKTNKTVKEAALEILGVQTLMDAVSASLSPAEKQKSPKSVEPEELLHS